MQTSNGHQNLWFKNPVSLYIWITFFDLLPSSSRVPTHPFPCQVATCLGQKSGRSRKATVMPWNKGRPGVLHMAMRARLLGMERYIAIKVEDNDNGFPLAVAHYETWIFRRLFKMDQSYPFSSFALIVMTLHVTSLASSIPQQFCAGTLL